MPQKFVSRGDAFDCADKRILKEGKWQFSRQAVGK